MLLDLRDVAPLLEVFDMPAALDFYHRVLEFEIEQSAGPDDDPGWVMLTRGEMTLMLNTAYERGERPVAPDPARVAAHSDTALFFGCPDVDAMYEHLRANDVACEPPAIASYGMKQLYARDPDGYGLCFQWPA